MARYAREKCGANSVFWLATSAGRDNPSCPLFERRLCLGHIGQYNKLFIEQACLRTMPKYQPRSLRRALLSPYFGHPREPRGSQTAVRWLGTIIRSIFCAQSGASIRLTVWNGLVKVGTQDLFRPSLKTFVAKVRSQHSLDRLERSAESRYPGPLPPILENFRRAFSPDPTDCPWASEDVLWKV